MRKYNDFFKIVLVGTTILFFSWLIPHKMGPNKLLIQSEDTLPAMFIPVAILKEGTIFLDSYYETLVQRYPQPDDKNQELGLVPYYLRKTAENHYVSAFPIITPLLALPIYFLPVSLGMEITWDNLAILASLSSAFIVAISGGFLYLLLKKHFFVDEDSIDIPFWKQKSFLLTAIYLFGTINYAHISQALWQHGTVQLFTILALLAFYEKRYFFQGLSFGLMLLSRPTSGIAVFFLGIILLVFLLKSGPRKFVYFSTKLLFGMLLPALFFLWYNSTFYGTIANQGYSNQIFTEWQGRFPEGFLGLWLSPSKGILIYSPIFIFSLVGAYLSGKNWRKNLDYTAFFAIVLVHALVLGKWKHWYGGWSFGYRMASDILPFLILLLVPFVKSSLFQKYKKLFFSLFGISVLWQLMGLVFYDGIWHAAYDGGFRETAWLWSVKNSELAFNIRRVLVRLGLRQSPF
jgi:hypothetical protein